MASTTTTHLPLAELIQVLWMRRRNGIVQLLNGDEHGSIHVSDGRLIEATISLAAGRERVICATGEDALRQMLAWHRPTFRFRHDPLLGKRPSRISRGDERRIQDLISRNEHCPVPALTLDTILQVGDATDAQRPAVFLSAEAWGVLVGASKGLSIRDIGAEIGLGDQQIVALASDLVARGIVAEARLAAPSERLLADRALLEASGARGRTASLLVALPGRPLGEGAIFANSDCRPADDVAA